MVAGTSTPHGNCVPPPHYGAFANTPNSNQHGNQYHGFHGHYHNNNQMTNPSEGFGHMASGPGVGVEPWKGPEFGSTNQRARRVYHQSRGGGAERPGRSGRGGRQRYAPHYGQYGRGQSYYHHHPQLPGQ